MATRNIVPRATGEGSIGTSAKTWDAGYFDDLAVTNGVTASTFTGDLTGDVTGDLTGTASGNLPLTGGTMTGGITYSGVNVVAAQSEDTDEYVEIVGGTNESTGAHISVYGKDHASKPGNITMEAYDGTNSNRMTLEPTGSAQIGGKEVERVNSSGTGYIRFESGLQICWNRVSSVPTSGKAETFPAAFKTGSTPRLAIATATNAIAIAFSGLSESGCTFKSASGSQAMDYIAIGVWK